MIANAAAVSLSGMTLYFCRNYVVERWLSSRISLNDDGHVSSNNLIVSAGVFFILNFCKETDWSIDWKNSLHVVSYQKIACRCDGSVFEDDLLKYWCNHCVDLRN